MQGRRRHRKVVHFDRLKLCPKNIRLDDELTNEQHTSSQELIPPTENSLLIGHDLEMVDADDDEADNATVTTPHTPMDTTSQAELAMPSGRYPRREHRPPSRFTDFVSLDLVTDGTSPFEEGDELALIT